MANGNLIPATGDIVSLISGGPPMTVEGLAPAKPPVTPLPPGVSAPVFVDCIWFNAAGAVARHSFNAALLTESGSSGAASPPSVAS